MRRELIIFMVLFSVFLAIGCTSNTGNNTQKPAIPPENPSIPISNATYENSVLNSTSEIPISDATSKAPALNTTPETPVEGKIIRVSIKDFAFNPDAVTISAGDTVRWMNLDPTTHTIKGSDFKSNTLREGDSYEFLFPKAGVYEYECSIHPSMKGTVTVTE